MTSTLVPADNSEAPPPLGRRRLVLIATVCAVLAALIVGGTAMFVSRQSATVDHHYVIPDGTAAKIDAGEPVNILPDELHVAPGDTLTVVNNDVEAHFVGVASVEPGDTMTYRFPRRGQYDSVCTIHQNGAISIYVDG